MPLTLPQNFSDVLDYRHVLWKRKWTVLLCLVILLLFTGYPIYKEDPHFFTSAQILLSHAPPSALDMQDVFQPSRRWEPRRQEPDAARLTLLSSRLLAERVIRKEGLLEDSPLVPPMTYGWRYYIAKPIPAPVRSWIKERLGMSDSPETEEGEEMRWVVNNYLQSLKVAPTEGGLVTVSFHGTSPAGLREILAAHLREFIKLDLEVQFETSDEAAEWIEERLEQAKQRLETSSLAVLTFAEEHGVAPEIEAFTASQELGTILSAYVIYQQEIQKLQVSMKLLQELLKNPNIIESLPSDVRQESPMLEKLKTDFLLLAAQYNSLSMQFGPDHPNMVRARNQLHNMRQQIREEAQRLLRTMESQRTFYEEMIRRSQKDQRKEEEVSRRRAVLRVQFEALNSQVESNRQVYEEVLAKLNLMKLMGNVQDDTLMSTIKVIDPPQPPVIVAGGGKMNRIVKAGGMGLLLGVAVAFLLEFLDNVIRTPKDIQRFLTLPFLGFVPRLLSAQQEKKDHRGRSFVTILDPSSSEAESIRNVRTNLIFSFADRSSHAVMFTSPMNREGKSTVTAQLAASISQLGKKTLLVDTDLRRPTLHKILRVENTSGVSDILIGETTFEEAVHHTDLGPLDFLSAGTIPPNPSELLGSDAMRRLIEEMKSRYDMVLFDSPPILPVVDAKVLGSLLDGVCLVPRSGRTTLKSLTQSVHQMEERTIRMLGVVLNDLDMTEFATYYGYSYGYYEDTGEQEEEVGRPSIPA